MKPEKKQKSNNILNRKEEINLLQQIKNGNVSAKNKFVEMNQGLVFSIAKKYAYLHYNLADLVAEGNLGLLKAIEKYDTKKNTKFSTYAYFWIKRYILRAVMDQSLTAPENVQKLKKKYKDIMEQFKLVENRYPTENEIASLLNLDLKSFLRYKIYFETTMILPFMYGNVDNELDIFDIKSPEKNSDDWDKMLTDKDFLNILFKRLIEKFKKKNKTVFVERWIYALKLHYGLENGNCYSYKEIAEKMNISRQRVHQIIKTCMKYLHQEIKEMKNEGII